VNLETAERAKKFLLRIRRPLVLIVGGSLFTTSVLTLHNVQLEGLFFGLMTGIFVGPVLHYALGKFLIPLPFGRVWCGWACWTGALLEQLPYRKSAGWLPAPWRNLRYLHFGLSLALVALCVFGLGQRGGAVGSSAVLWFVGGNMLYWSIGIALAVRLRDNRAFCKYVCPVAVILKPTSRLSLLKIAGDANACLSCRSHACMTLCPMDIQIDEYVKRGQRVCSTECIACLQCVAICPPNRLKPSFGLDWSVTEYLKERPSAYLGDSRG
jgi:ferredoxin-type protein NapH